MLGQELREESHGDFFGTLDDVISAGAGLDAAKLPSPHCGIAGIAATPQREAVIYRGVFFKRLLQRRNERSLGVIPSEQCFELLLPGFVNAAEFYQPLKLLTHTVFSEAEVRVRREQALETVAATGGDAQAVDEGDNGLGIVSRRLRAGGGSESGDAVARGDEFGSKGCPVELSDERREIGFKRREQLREQRVESIGRQDKRGDYGFTSHPFRLAASMLRERRERWQIGRTVGYSSCRRRHPRPSHPGRHEALDA